MKITIDLPGELLAKAQALATRQKISLESMIDRALVRELMDNREPSQGPGWRVNEHGFPVLESTGKTKVTSEQIYEILEREYDWA